MSKSISLSKYVKRRTGVRLGAPNSLRNMLQRSFGAGSFHAFWNYWNPIWGYYLARYFMKPMRKVFPEWASVLLTFAVSGALHDLAVSLIKWKVIFLITPWFFLMGALVVLSKYFDVSYRSLQWLPRAFINLFIIAASLGFTYIVEGYVLRFFA